MSISFVGILIIFSFLLMFVAFDHYAINISNYVHFLLITSVVYLSTTLILTLVNTKIIFVLKILFIFTLLIIITKSDQLYKFEFILYSILLFVSVSFSSIINYIKKNLKLRESRENKLFSKNEFLLSILIFVRKNILNSVQLLMLFVFLFVFLYFENINFQSYVISLSNNIIDNSNVTTFVLFSFVIFNTVPLFCKNNDQICNKIVVKWYNRYIFSCYMSLELIQVVALITLNYVSKNAMIGEVVMFCIVISIVNLILLLTKLNLYMNN